MWRMPSTWMPSKSTSAAEGDAAQNRQLVRGVDAVDVESGIGLGVAEILRLGEDVGEVPPAFRASSSGYSCRCR